MSRKQATPGEWQWYWRESAINAGETDCGVFAEERPGMAISVCRAPRYEKREQWEANAPLLCKSKDMAIVLRELLDSGSYPTAVAEKAEKLLADLEAK